MLIYRQVQILLPANGAQITSSILSRKSRNGFNKQKKLVQSLCKQFENGRGDLATVHELNSLLAITGDSIPTDVEIAVIAVALEHYPTDTQLIARLCQLTHNRGEVVAKRLATSGLPIAHAFPNLNPRPLFFVHIPKTAGASVIQYLDSQFDNEYICPAWNPADLADLGSEAQRYFLFRGHFTAGQTHYALQEVELFSILRNPADQIYSFYAWLKRLDRTYWKTAEKAAAEQDAKLATGFAMREQRKEAESAMDAAKKLSFLEFLQKEDYITRMFTENIAMYCLSDIGSNSSTELTRSKRHHSLIESSAWHNFGQCTVIGIFEHLYQTLMVLCWHRKWAAPCNLSRIHSKSKRRSFQPIDFHVKRLLKKKARIDNKLYAAAKNRLNQDWHQLTLVAGGSDRVPEFIDAEHCRHFFSATSPVYAVDVSADRAWPGTGWGLRERNEHGQVWRWIGSSARSTFLANLVPGTDYLLSLVIYTAADGVTLNSLDADIHGKPLQFAGESRHAGYEVRYWRISKDIVAQYAGQLEIALSVNATANENSIALSRIVCHPW